MKFICRQFEREGTEKEVESDESDLAPDAYVHENCKMHVGGVTYIEVLVDGTWELWRVEGIEIFGMLAYRTGRVSLEEVRDEIREYMETSN